MAQPAPWIVLLALIGLVQVPAGPGAAKPKTKPEINSIGMRLVEIPGGSFDMGSTIGPGEAPVHRVSVRSFWMGATEVTQAQWQAVMGNNPSHFKAAGPNAPVEMVTWEDAQAFVRKLSEREPGWRYRLPSEAEWEYACLAGTAKDPYGPGEDIAWIKENSGGTTHPVGLKLPNAFGLHDMFGNVPEWTQDSWHDSHSGAPTDGSAREAGGPGYHTLKGGGWDLPAFFLHAALRGPYGEIHRRGFRVAADQTSTAGLSGAAGPSQPLPPGWSRMDSGTTNNLTGLWGSSPTDVFAVGPKGTILHFDGLTWSAMALEGSTHLLSIWGSSSRDVFVVGDNGVIVHYDGQAWTPMASGTTKNLISVWGTSSRDVFAAGYGGTVLHYDGIEWSPMVTGTTEDLYCIWGTASNHVVAVGGTPMPLPGKGLVLHFDGKTWSPMAIPDTPFLGGVWGSSRDDAFAVGVNLAILRFDGKAWAGMAANAPVAPGKPNLLMRAWGRGPNDVYAAGFDGVLLHCDGRAWSPVPLGTTEGLGVFGVGPSDVFVVGGGGIILHQGPK